MPDVQRQWGTVREDYSDSGDAWSMATMAQGLAPATRPAGPASSPALMQLFACTGKAAAGI